MSGTNGRCLSDKQMQVLTQRLMTGGWNSGKRAGLKMCSLDVRHSNSVKGQMK